MRARNYLPSELLTHLTLTRTLTLTLTLSRTKVASSHAPIIMLRNALVAMPTAKVSPNPNQV